MEVVASLSQNRTAAAQCGLFTYKSVPVIFEPHCITQAVWMSHIEVLFRRIYQTKLFTTSLSLSEFYSECRTSFLHGCTAFVVITYRRPLLHSVGDDYKSHRQDVITSRQQRHLLHHLIEFPLIFYVVTSL